MKRVLVILTLIKLFNLIQLRAEAPAKPLFFLTSTENTSCLFFTSFPYPDGLHTQNTQFPVCPLCPIFVHLTDTSLHCSPKR